MILDSSTRVLQFSMAEAVTTNNLNYAIDYEDKIVERVTPIVNLGVIAAAAAATVLLAPGDNTRRLISEINICNLDTVSHTITVSIVDGVTTYNIHRATLTAGQNLVYNQFEGWTIQ